MPEVIKVEQLSKAYQLGAYGTGTLTRDLERYWAKIRGKEDPFLKIGEVNDQTTKSKSDIVWSLKDLNFEVEQGDAVGIIGRNGAGKSTLLKILSRVTAPTSGSIKVKGRVASLLEVGTGFHPELTGRENIYLNGAILGMRKAEIKRQFDGIVNFAGVERYIDTPVKRYSSGMYVRLAFAVAAYLESEILIVDEVLAVGDAGFQKKCLGKMGDISKGQGRTVLFVSHNMSSIRQLCNKGILLNNGSISFNGAADAAVSGYINDSRVHKKEISAIGTLAESIKINGITINGSGLDIALVPKDEIVIAVKYECAKYLPAFRMSFTIQKEGMDIFTIHDLKECEPLEPGRYESKVKIPDYFLRPGIYTVSAGGHNVGHSSYSVGNVEWLFAAEIGSFEILESWSEQFDFNNKGLVNISNANGERKSI